jgi:hypothetical protein
VSGRRPALILLLFAAARISLLIFRAPFYDELFTRWISGKPFGEIIAALRHDSGLPLYYFVVHLLGDPSVVMIRVISLICAVISIVLILRKAAQTRVSVPQNPVSSDPGGGGIDRKPCGTDTLVCAAVLLATFPPAILFAVDGRAYAMCAMFLTIAILAIDDDSPFVAALALVAAAYSHYYGVLFFPLLLIPRSNRRRWYAVALAILLYIPGFWLALHQPAEARAWMTAAWPDALFIRPPLALSIIGVVVIVMSIRVNRYLFMTLIPLALALALRVYVPMRFEAVLAVPLVLWLAQSLKENRFRTELTTALIGIGVIWTTLGIIEHHSRPLDPYRRAALWAAANIPANEIVVASGYCYLEALMSGHRSVMAFPPEQAEHPGWRAMPRPGVVPPAGAFFWIGERAAPELAVFTREHRIIEPLCINDRAMVALVR